MNKEPYIILGIDPGLANTGWGIVKKTGSHLDCLAYGCISTSKEETLSKRLLKIHDQMSAVVQRFQPDKAGIESILFCNNANSAFLTGQARGAAIVACAAGDVEVFELTPKQIKLAITGTGSADKNQIQYMVKNMLKLDAPPQPDHSADALAAAICTSIVNSGVYEKAGINGAAMMYGERKRVYS